MDNPTNALLLQAAIATPLAAALLLGLGLTGPRLARQVAAVAFTVPALIALWLWSQFPANAAGHYQFLSNTATGLQGFGISLRLGLNGISVPLFVLAATVGFAAGIYALRSGAERLQTYLMLLLIMQSGLLGTFASVDLFFFYFFHELALIPTFLMVGLWGGRDRNYAAMKMTVYLTLGAMLSLLGLLAIYSRSGAETFDLIALRDELAANPLHVTTQKHIFGLLLFGFGTLVSLWPFHTWAPLGYGAAPSSAAMLHAGVLKKFGLYGLLQVALPLLPQGALADLAVAFPAWTHLPAIHTNWVWVLALLAGFGNVLGLGLVTLAQRDLKQMIGYSSVMHMGYCFLGVATLSVAGSGGVVLLMVGHGLSVALLFLLATSIHHRTRTFDLAEMGGLAQQTPVLAAFFVAATLAGLGLPGFANFWGELTIFVSLWPFSHWLTAVAVSGVVLSAIYGLRAAARVFFGPPSVQWQGVRQANPPADLDWSERLPALALLALLCFLGFWPRSLSAAADQALRSSPAAPAAAVSDQR